MIFGPPSPCIPASSSSSTAHSAAYGVWASGLVSTALCLASHYYANTAAE